MIELLALSIVNKLVKGAFGSLSRRHSVDLPYLLDNAVELQFKEAVRVATVAFLKRLSKIRELDEPNISVLSSYLTSKSVSDEVSKLLDPGLEVFDSGSLLAMIHRYTQRTDEPEMDLTHLDEKALEEAWGEFLKAFSFASRSAPELREFLRASYEAGSFRALSDIGSVLERMDHDLTLLSEQESLFQESIALHSSDLAKHRNWARTFTPSERGDHVHRA
jgi:hypothetical protein